MFQENLDFVLKMRSFKRQVFAFVSELIKEEGKRDFDKMARMINDLENLGGKGIIKWALDRVQTIFPQTATQHTHS